MKFLNILEFKRGKKNFPLINNIFNSEFPSDKAISFKKILEYSSEKKDITDLFPSKIRRAIKKSSEPPVIVELAGKDSIAAIIKSVEDYKFKVILPIDHFLPIQYGSWKINDINLKYLREILEPLYKVKILDYIVIEDIKFWYLLNSRYTQEIINFFGFYTPCLGCHLFFHVTCGIIAKILNSNIVISGEREFHDDFEKINQLDVSIDMYKEYLESMGIQHFQPIRYIKEGKKIEEILQNTNIKYDERQKKCIFSGNYKSVNNNSIYDKQKITQFFIKYAIPITNKIINLRKQNKRDDEIERIINKFLSKDLFISSF